jgi:hypothetical protein
MDHGLTPGLDEQVKSRVKRSERYYSARDWTLITGFVLLVAGRLLHAYV